MASELTQEELVERAKQYLKETYGEDTLRMDVIENTVSEGTGRLSVSCTVSWRGHQSNWHKVFYFEGGRVANMSARQV